MDTRWHYQNVSLLLVKCFWLKMFFLVLLKVDDES